MLGKNNNSKCALQLLNNPSFQLDLTQFSNTKADNKHYPLSLPLYQNRESNDHKDFMSNFKLNKLLMSTLILNICMTVVMTLLVVGLLYFSFRVNQNMLWYYNASKPYVEEMKLRGMSILRHADNSTISLSKVISGAEVITQNSIPALLDSVNLTTAMIARMNQITKNPTIKLSLG
jgi:hypothetical protein